MFDKIFKQSNFILNKISHRFLRTTKLFTGWKQSSWSKGISELKSKQQSPCSNGLWCHGAMHAISACIGLWHHGLITWLLYALTAWDLKFQVCLRYTFTPPTLGWKSLIIVLPRTLCLSSIIPCWATLEDAACMMCTRRAIFNNMA